MCNVHPSSHTQTQKPKQRTSDICLALAGAGAADVLFTTILTTPSQNLSREGIKTATPLRIR